MDTKHSGLIVCTEIFAYDKVRINLIFVVVMCHLWVASNKNMTVMVMTAFCHFSYFESVCMLFHN